jgi:glycosyltransferase involved in cell wall biosynthesis
VSSQGSRDPGEWTSTEEPVSRSRVRILLFAWHVPSGGLAKVLQRELEYGRHSGYEVEALAYDYSSPSAYKINLANSGFTFLKPFASALRLPRSASQRDAAAGRRPVTGPSLPVTLIAQVTWNFRRRRYDVLICHELFSAICIAPLAILQGKPVVLVLHDSPLPSSPGEGTRGLHGNLLSKVMTYLVERTIRLASLVVCTTPQIADSIGRMSLGSRVTVIQYGMDVDLSPKPYGERDIVLTVSKWSKWRRPEVYIRLARALPQTTRLYVVGRWESASERSEIQAEVFRMGLQDRVVITGEVSEAELASLYRRAKLFVRFGFAEVGTGQGVVEAIGYGCPVLINRSLGASGLVVHGVHGLVLSNDQALHAEIVLRKLLEDPDLGARMAINCLQLARQHPWREYVSSLFESATSLSSAGGTPGRGGDDE